MDDETQAPVPSEDEAAELAAPLTDAPPVPADDPEIGIDGVGAGDLP